MFALLFMLAQFQGPLPELGSFLEVTRSGLIDQLDEQELLAGYVYHRKRNREELDDDGRGKTSELEEHEIVQFNTGYFERLVSRNGVPLPEQELKRHKDRDSGPPFTPKSREDRLAMIDDMFRVWEFQMIRRQVIRGRPAIMIAFAPKKDAKPKTLSGKWMFRNSEGVAWIDEDDHRIVRMRTVVTKDMSLAWGMFAKVHKGTEITREWRKVNNEVWLPAWTQRRIRARAFMIGFHFVEIEEYSDYRKFNVETKLRFDSPK